MKKFFRCPECGEEFCLKGRKYCKKTEAVYCEGEITGINKAFKGNNTKAHKQTKMEYAGNTIKDLRALRKKQKARGRK